MIEPIVIPSNGAVKIRQSLYLDTNGLMSVCANHARIGPLYSRMMPGSYPVLARTPGLLLCPYVSHPLEHVATALS